MWSREKLMEWSKPALKYPELIEIARTASSNTEAKNRALEFTTEEGLDGQVAKACRWLRMLRVAIGDDQFEEFISSQVTEDGSMDTPSDTRKDPRKELTRLFEEDSPIKASRARIESFETQIKQLEAGIDETQKSICARKREIAMELGLVISSVDELKCKRHPKSRFNIEIIEAHTVQTSDVINKSSVEKSLNRREAYVCVECRYEHEEETIAYSCPNCGIVYGELDSIDWPFQGWGARRYVCYVCEAILDCCWGISD